MGSSIPGRLDIPAVLLSVIICMILIVSSGCMEMTENGNNTAADEIHPANENETIPTVEINETATPATSLPEIIPAEVTGDMYEDRTFNVYFEKSQYELTLPVNLSVYYGAKNAEKSITPGTMWNETEKVSEYYRSFFEGEAIEGFYTDILKKIRHIKIAEGFSDEEYLEFMITFVQQIPYDSGAYEPRFPVEVHLRHERGLR